MSVFTCRPKDLPRPFVSFANPAPPSHGCTCQKDPRLARWNLAQNKSASPMKHLGKRRAFGFLHTMSDFIFPAPEYHGHMGLNSGGKL